MEKVSVVTGALGDLIVFQKLINESDRRPNRFIESDK